MCSTFKNTNVPKTLHKNMIVGQLVFFRFVVHAHIHNSVELLLFSYSLPHLVVFVYHSYDWITLSDSNFSVVALLLFACIRMFLIRSFRPKRWLCVRVRLDACVEETPIWGCVVCMTFCTTSFFRLWYEAANLLIKISTVVFCCPTTTIVKLKGH